MSTWLPGCQEFSRSSLKFIIYDIAGQVCPARSIPWRARGLTGAIVRVIADPSSLPVPLHELQVSENCHSRSKICSARNRLGGRSLPQHRPAILRSHSAVLLIAEWERRRVWVGHSEGFRHWCGLRRG